MPLARRFMVHLRLLAVCPKAPVLTLHLWVEENHPKETPAIPECRGWSARPLTDPFSNESRSWELGVYVKKRYV